MSHPWTACPAAASSFNIVNASRYRGAYCTTRSWESDGAYGASRSDRVSINVVAIWQKLIIKVNAAVRRGKMTNLSHL